MKQLEQNQPVHNPLSEERLDAGDLKGSRRSRKDQLGRDFICGCGKKYLSYPALYTHVKTKHSGHQPQGTQKTTTAATNKSRSKPKIDQKFVKQTEQWVGRDHLRVLIQIGSEGLGEIAPVSRIKKQYVGEFIWQSFIHYTKNPNFIILNKKSNIQMVLIVYLMGVGQFVSEPLMKYYNIFAKFFRRCFLDHLTDIAEVYLDEAQRPKNLTNQQAKNAPYICDFFIRYFLPAEVKDPQQINLLELMTLDFCKWMSAKKLTDIKVALTKPYKLNNCEMFQNPKNLKDSEKKKKDDQLDEKQEIGRESNRQNSMPQSINQQNASEMEIQHHQGDNLM